MPTPSSKLLSFSTAPKVFEQLKTQGKKLVQCHGTFDLIHPGHIYHLEAARELGDALVVTVTSEKYVNKGPGRPYFNDELRAKSLCALECVDYVVMIPYPTAVEAIECVKPSIYCKGKEYEDNNNDVTGNIRDDVSTVEKYGGEVRFLGAVVFSSTRLVNQHLHAIAAPVKQFCSKLACSLSTQQFRQYVDDFAQLKVLIIGDIIFDRYSYLKVQGLTSKNRIISGRYLMEETQAGGSLAVYRHVKQFTQNVKLIGLLGTESWTDSLVREFIPKEDDQMIRDEGFTTIIKQRFVEPISEGKEMSKLFSVNFLDANPPDEELQAKVLNQIKSQIKSYDLIMVTDFGHGLLQPKIRELIQAEAPFLSLNCQTNSNNYGYNIINRQYQRADVFTLDAQEIHLACGHRHIDFTAELNKLRHQLKSQYAWLTRGAVETIGLLDGQDPVLCPPFENEVVDTVGAGDAFFSVVSLAAARKMSINTSTFLGQLAGAQAVKIIGNSQSISKSKLLKGGQTLLNV